jgi:hypothetical protein
MRRGEDVGGQQGAGIACREPRCTWNTQYSRSKPPDEGHRATLTLPLLTAGGQEKNQDHEDDGIGAKDINNCKRAQVALDGLPRVILNTFQRREGGNMKNMKRSINSQAQPASHSILLSPHTSPPH